MASLRRAASSSSIYSASSDEVYVSADEGESEMSDSESESSAVSVHSHDEVETAPAKVPAILEEANAASATNASSVQSASNVSGSSTSDTSASTLASSLQSAQEHSNEEGGKSGTEKPAAAVHAPPTVDAALVHEEASPRVRSHSPSALSVVEAATRTVLPVAKRNDLVSKGQTGPLSAKGTLEPSTAAQSGVARTGSGADAGAAQPKSEPAQPSSSVPSRSNERVDSADTKKDDGMPQSRDSGESSDGSAASRDGAEAHARDPLHVEGSARMAASATPALEAGASAPQDDQPSLIVKCLDTGTVYDLAAVETNGGVIAPEERAFLEGFVIKNLDTGEQLREEDLERIERGTDPLYLNMKSRSGMDSSSSSDEDDSIGRSHRSKRRGPLRRWRRRSEDSGDESVVERNKTHVHKKELRELHDVKLLQELKGHHSGAIWTMQFNPGGNYLCTAGHDGALRVWAVAAGTEGRQSPEQVGHSQGDTGEHSGASSSADPRANGAHTGPSEIAMVTEPLRVYMGHKMDILDVAWSTSNFILSSSMDKTVRLWHVSVEDKCLGMFAHPDFVTSVVFHPYDEKIFLSGSFDSRVRIWNIPERKVISWIGLEELVTACAFSPDGTRWLAGTFKGKVKVYEYDTMDYVTTIDVRSTRGRNKRGKKITGIEFVDRGKRLLVSSNDSRIRLYSMKDYSLVCKYKGLQNRTSQIQASLSSDGAYILCGSEDHRVYVWNTDNRHHLEPSFFHHVRKDRNEAYESFYAHDNIVTGALFFPGTKDSLENARFVSASYNGDIRIFENRKPRPERAETAAGRRAPGNV